METKHHWLTGFMVVVLIVVAIVQGNMVHDLRQRVARLETGMSGVSQQMQSDQGNPGTSMGPSTPSGQTNTNSSTNQMDRMNQPSTNTNQ